MYLIHVNFVGLLLWVELGILMCGSVIGSKGIGLLLNHMISYHKQTSKQIIKY